MPVIKLDQSHRELCKDIFNHDKFMGLEVNEQVNNVLYDRFCNTYLFDLKNFHCFANVIDEQIKALITFYESVDEPAWYYTLYRSMGDNNLLREVLDTVIEYNEKNGRLKFYTLVRSNHSKLLRRFHWSKYNNERYGYFDECLVPARHKSYYNNHWELLFKNILLPEDSVVRCNFLKQEYRKTLPIGGNL